MRLAIEQIIKKLKDAGLKVTPQRLSILEAVYNLGNHPTAENIFDHIRTAHPGIATGTVYKVLDALVENGLIKRVKTDKDAMRYDGLSEIHHHLYCADSEEIEDYFDDELDKMLRKYFKRKGISNFEIKDITLQINGNFIKSK